MTGDLTLGGGNSIQPSHVETVLKAGALIPTFMSDSFTFPHKILFLRDMENNFSSYLTDTI